jgi:hypothetical protein
MVEDEVARRVVDGLKQALVTRPATEGTGAAVCEATELSKSGLA